MDIFVKTIFAYYAVGVLIVTPFWTQFLESLDKNWEWGLVPKKDRKWVLIKMYLQILSFWPYHIPQRIFKLLEDKKEQEDA